MRRATHMKRCLLVVDGGQVVRGEVLVYDCDSIPVSNDYPTVDGLQRGFVVFVRQDEKGAKNDG